MSEAALAARAARFGKAAVASPEAAAPLPVKAAVPKQPKQPKQPAEAKEEATEEGKEHGIVKQWGSKHFGFITASSGGDLFVRSDDLLHGIGMLRKGQSVLFVRSSNDTGGTAVRVELESSAGAAASEGAGGGGAKRKAPAAGHGGAGKRAKGGAKGGALPAGGETEDATAKSAEAPTDLRKRLRTQGAAAADAKKPKAPTDLRQRLQAK